MALGKRHFHYCLIILILLLGVFFLLATSTLPFDTKIYSVRSGSMEPTIPSGSLIVVVPADFYSQGDIITFKSSTESKTTTHRIFRTHEAHGENYFITKGDANDALDSPMVHNSDIVGKLKFSLPLLGYLISFIKTVPGLILLFYLPATFIIINEFLKINRALRKSL